MWFKVDFFYLMILIDFHFTFASRVPEETHSLLHDYESQ